MERDTPVTSPGRFLSIADVKHETTLSPVTIWRRVRSGQFPRPHAIGGGRKVWLEREIEDWKQHILAHPPS